MPKIPVKVVKWDEIVDLSNRLATKLKEAYVPDILIAIARGGLVPARLVADALGIYDVISIKVEHWIVTASHTPEARIKYPFTVDLSGKNVLIIDDITDTGDSLILAKNFVRENFKAKEIRTSTLQYIVSSKYIPDYYADTIKDWTWFMYPWNYWEDVINLTKKLIDEGVREDSLEESFKENYGSYPPIPMLSVIEEMKRRKIIA
ncbi:MULTISPECIES: phosphoribosyltransferase [Acidianus]|uniref:Phosphoribosyltransferase n=1 Tax=Candidatus Acidianus copahuensis TaxID=1160895 RepID=A0A031LTL2_9CREN|nr:MULTISPECIES: phosphoribosyltransferase [Acidianus]EZQ11131.1 phosphoribosyltransferase [Candidatus Acidianus copahuensis]NON63669.1 phosphoribosyltransferase [Acidianus sp. RZ1]